MTRIYVIGGSPNLSISRVNYHISRLHCYAIGTYLRGPRCLCLRSELTLVLTVGFKFRATDNSHD